jgi:hypothetical protein
VVAKAKQLGGPAMTVKTRTEAELDVHDPRFPVLTTIVCRLPR